MDKQREEIFDAAMQTIEGVSFEYASDAVIAEYFTIFALEQTESLKAQLQTAVAQNEKLTAERAVAVKALERIRDMDYRGNRHSSADIADIALAKIQGESK